MKPAINVYADCFVFGMNIECWDLLSREIYFKFWKSNDWGHFYHTIQIKGIFCLGTVFLLIITDVSLNVITSDADFS